MVEISSLADVYDSVAKQYENPNALILGDFNADCRYFPLKYRNDAKLYAERRFLWLIPDNADTTVARKNSCAYDRIVVPKDTWIERSVVKGSAKVFRYDRAIKMQKDTAFKISDHYPVEVKINGRSFSDSFFF